MFTPDWLRILSDILIPDSNIAFFCLAFMLKCLLVSLYCLLLCLAVRLVKRLWGNKMSVRANYYSRYALLLCFPLSGLGFNTALKLPFYDIFTGSYSLNFADETAVDMDAIRQFFITIKVLQLLLWIATLVWLAAVLVKCLRRMATNIRLKRTICRQKAFDDPEGLKDKAAAAFGLRPERISVVAADFIRSPVSYGVLRKTILLPHDYGDRYSLPELYLLLLHEMGHIQNHDTVKLQLMDVAACFIWSTSLMKNQFVCDSELLCDNRVLGIEQEEQDTYAELMVRECSDKRAVRGLAFSDSFHTIKSRLDAIYSRRPETHRVAAFAVAVLLVLATSAAYASQHPASWLKTATEEDMHHYVAEGEFDVYVQFYDAESDDIVRTEAHTHIPSQVDGEFVVLDFAALKQTPEYRAVSATWRYEDGWLVVDKVALYAYLQPYIQEGCPVTGVQYFRRNNQYISTERQGLWGETSGWTQQGSRVYTLDLGELEQAGEEDRYARIDTNRATREELAYRFIAHWL